MSKPKRIFIVGHSGAGKGVFAQALAEKLGWQFIDADFAIAPTIGRNMSDVLSAQGEKAFHHCLTEILTYQTTKENIVVTTDDSIICDEKNREILSTEYTIFLQVSTSVQLQRIGHNRPLLPSKDYQAFLEKLHHERDALYDEVASFTLSSDDNALDEHVEKTLKALQ